MGALRVTFTQRDQGGPPTSSEEVRVEQPLEEPVGVNRGKTWKRHPKLRDNIYKRAAFKEHTFLGTMHHFGWLKSRLYLHILGSCRKNEWWEIKLEKEAETESSLPCVPFEVFHLYFLLISQGSIQRFKAWEWPSLSNSTNITGYLPCSSVVLDSEVTATVSAGFPSDMIWCTF